MTVRSYFLLYLNVKSYCILCFCTFAVRFSSFVWFFFSCLNRKYKPLHVQSLTFPSLWYSGRFSPFESPPPEFEKYNKPVQTKTRYD